MLTIGDFTDIPQNRTSLQGSLLSAFDKRIKLQRYNVIGVVIMFYSSLHMFQIAMCETITVREEKANNTESSGCTLCCLVANPRIAKFSEVFLVFLFGFAIEESLSLTTKTMVGRLRPHFLDVCRPNYTTFSCTDERGRPRYVTEDVCTGTDHRNITNMR